jgi:tetratricopeptide (TPR) repeat protein
MKAKQRHELHTNALAEWLTETSEKLRPYSGAILAGLAAAAIAIAIFYYVQSSKQSKVVAASDQLLAAISAEGTKDLEEVAREYPATSQGTLFRNKPAGRQNIEKAIEEFSKVGTATRDSMLRAWALYGLGRGYESLNDLTQARLSYQELLETYPNSALAKPAREHLERLGQKPVQEFYDWFAKQDPQPPSAAGPGIPGLKPSFDLKEPSSPGETKFPEPSSNLESSAKSSESPVTTDKSGPAAKSNPPLEPSK